MKKHELLGVVLVISAMFACSNANAAYYDFQEIQGKNGTEVIVSVSKKPTAKSAETVSVQKDSAKTAKENVLAKYNIETANKPQLKPKEPDVVAIQPSQKDFESTKVYENPKVAINTTPVEQNFPQKTESYNKIEQPAQEQFEAKVEQNSKYYTNWSNAEAERIITRIGNNLKTANGLDMPLQFYLIEEEEVNACTDIDNNIYVFNGILPYVETEDELAFIIGHEMGHAASKHVAKGVVTNEVAGVANAIGKDVLRTKVTNAAASKVSGLGFGFGKVASDTVVGAGDLAVDAATSAATNKLDRGRENDADLLAIDYLVKKGYNPLAGISIMAKIGDVYPDLFSDHPSTDKRVVTMYKYVQKKYPQYLSKGFGTDAYSMAVAQYVKKR